MLPWLFLLLRLLLCLGAEVWVIRTAPGMVSGRFGLLVLAAMPPQREVPDAYPLPYRDAFA